MVKTILLLLALAATGCESRAARPVALSLPECSDGEVLRDGACVSALDAFAAPGGRTFVVDGSAATASDNGPGTAARPWRTISRAARPGVLQPGDAVVIREGVYRESIRPREGGRRGTRITFAAFPGERVVVTGADAADDGWVRQPDGAWRLAWAGPELKTYTDDPVFRRELLVADGEVMQPVFERADLRPGTFWVEGPPEAPRAVRAIFPDAKAPAEVGLIEIATRTYLFRPEADDPYLECGDPATPGWLRVVGITFRHATNRAQWGAVCAGSEGGLFEDVRAEWTNGRGIDVSGRGHTFLRTRADVNGQIGWGGSCTGCLLEGTAAVGNNWKGHDPFWEAGGGKWAETTDTVIRRHYAAFNDGPGIWLDGANADNTVEGSLVVGNEVAGIMLELETVRTLVQHNVVAATRWRAWSGAGILSQAASQNVISHNTLVANEGGGLWLRLDPERRAPDGHNVVINNWIVGNATHADEAREIQIEGADVGHARSNRLDGNVYGVVEGDPVWRSTFYLHPVPGGSYRGSDLREWQRLTGQDRSARRLAEPAEPVRASRVEAARSGARAAPLVPGENVGADARRVRADGRWRDAPRPRPRIGERPRSDSEGIVGDRP